MPSFLSPFPAFSSRNNVGGSSREDRETALMRCIHHLRAASGERSSAWLYLFIYIVIALYNYILICLYRYCVICLLLYCMLEAWKYCFLYIYILFLFLTSTSIFYDSGCRLSIIWLFTVQRYGGSVRYQTPGDALFG